MKKELMLKIGAAGGSLSICSVIEGNERTFFVFKNESILKGFLTEEDDSDLVYTHRSDALPSFEAAIDALDVYPRFISLSYHSINHQRRPSRA